jgi:acyl-CoA thioesterase-1
MLRLVRILFIALPLACLWTLPGASLVRAETLSLLALGDSLTAGYGVDGPQSYPAQLEAALRGRGWDVSVINGGVSGDTMAQGAARLDWSLTPEVDAVLVELGANDALRGLPTEQAEAALASILGALGERHLPALVMGMKAPPNMGPDYARAFEDMFARQATKHGAMLYPFFLEGVATDAALNQSDGIHPNAAGVARIVELTLPMVETLLNTVKSGP